jgi:Mg/Co/Ni transporter MgtE
LALGKIHNGNVWNYLKHEFKLGVAISGILGTAGCLRAFLFMVPITETIAITVSLFSIVWISTILGCLLPLAMQYIRIDPAHSSTTIQVVMDIVGVTITVCKFFVCLPFSMLLRVWNDG